MERVMKGMETAVKDNKAGTKEGRYLYCIIQTDKLKSFGPFGIGNRNDNVYTINYRDIACVVSNSPVTRYSVTRENTMAHQKVLEEVMKEFALLPVRFCTIADSQDEGVDLEERIKEKLLKERYAEFKDLLSYMNGKVELGLKVMWNSMDAIYGDVVTGNAEIRGLRESLIHESPEKTHYERIKLGEMVKKAIDDKKEGERKKILEPLNKLSLDTRTNNIFGDRMVLNAAFLVNSSEQKAFDNEVNNLEKSYNRNMKLKYVGPVPPYNFVEIVVIWDSG